MFDSAEVGGLATKWLSFDDDAVVVCAVVTEEEVGDGDDEYDVYWDFKDRIPAWLLMTMAEPAFEEA